MQPARLCRGAEPLPPARGAASRRRQETFCLGSPMKYQRVQLKVCEGCGGLWFRAEPAQEIYCHACAQRLSAFPKMRTKRRGRPCKGESRTAQQAGGVQ